METQQQKRLKQKKCCTCLNEKALTLNVRGLWGVSSGDLRGGYHLEHFVMRDTLAIVAVSVGIGTCASTEKTNA